MADDAKQAWNHVGERFASLGNRLSDKYRESGSGGDPGAAETQRKLQETAKEVGDQLSRAFDALGATIRDEEAKADLKRALNALEPEQRRAIECAYFDGLSHTQIAAELNKPLGTVKGYIRLGMDRLRELLQATGTEGRT